jgi:glycosyltransferase involved in cell wall biosynthesis
MNDTGAPRPFRPATPKAKPKILVELRPCAHGFSGIPQETRLIYNALSKNNELDVGALLNPFHDLVLPRGLRKASREANARHPAKQIYNQARFITAMDAEIEGVRRKDIFARWRRRLEERNIPTTLLGYLWPAKYYPLLPINSVDFEDFIWTRFFQKTLPGSERTNIIDNQFFAIEKGWGEAHSRCYNQRLSTKIDTKGWKFFLCQVPTPFAVYPETRIIVRYHDAIPLFLPHTTSVGAPDMKRHYRGLRASVHNGAFFVCTSEPVRADLLKLFPEVEPNTIVIPDMVSNEYHKVEPSPEGLARIIYVRECAETAPGRRSPGPKSIEKDYILSVSTLEPRKNFKLLLEAWESACQRLETGALLVLVANIGWRNTEEMDEIRKLIKGKRGVHLSRVPLHEMRMLYSGAQAVICPSRSEGFDLSGVEAMRCETPVIASDIAVHRWVYGDAALYFDPYDVNSCANMLVKTLSVPKDSGLMASLRDQGIERAKLYKRDVIGQQWADLLHRLSGHGMGTVPIASSVSTKRGPELSDAELA